MFKLLFPLGVGVLWTAGSLVVLLPVLGMAWVVTRLTELAPAEAVLVAFVNTAALVYLLQTYLAGSGLRLLYLALPLSAIALVVVTLEGLLVHNLTDLTMVQSTLVASGSSLLIAYMFGYSVTGSVPSFLRQTFVQDMMDDAAGDQVEYVDQEMPPPARKAPRKQRR